MKESTDKLITLVGLGVALLATVFAILFALNIQNESMFDITYWILICMVAVSICAILVFLFVKLAKQFKEEPGYWKKFLLILVLIVVACAASFLLAKGDDVSPAMLDKFEISLGTSKLIGAACILVYILVIAAACAIIYTECAKALKKK